MRGHVSRVECVLVLLRAIAAGNRQRRPERTGGHSQRADGGFVDAGQVALDLASRERRWKYDAARFVKSSPALAGDVLVAASDDGTVHALDAATGELRWRFRTGGIITSSPAVSGGTVFVGSHDGTLYAIE